MLDLNQYRTPDQIQKDLKDRPVNRRKERKLSQQELARRSGVSLGSLKRFEQTAQISLTSLLKIAWILDETDSFDQLFTEQTFNSIEEIIHAVKKVISQVVSASAFAKNVFYSQLACSPAFEAARLQKQHACLSMNDSNCQVFIFLSFFKTMSNC